MNNTQKAVNGNKSHISRLVAKVDEFAYNASSLLGDEIAHMGLTNDADMAKYMERLQSLEQEMSALQLEYAVEYHNIIIPMVRGFRQEQEKLAQKHAQSKIQIVRHRVPVLQMNDIDTKQNNELAKLQARQSADKKKAIEQMSVKLNQCKQDIRTIFVDALGHLYK